MRMEKDSDSNTILSGEDDQGFGEDDGLLRLGSSIPSKRPHKAGLTHILILYVCNVFSLAIVIVLWTATAGPGHDYSLGVYCKTTFVRCRNESKLKN